MKYHFLFVLLVTAFVTAMDNPGPITPAQEISLLQSFLSPANFEVTKDATVTYPHYKDNTQIFIHDRHDATFLLWQAKNDPAVLNSGWRLILELYNRLDRSQPLEPQLTDAHKLVLHRFLFHTFFTREDCDKHDDITIVPNGRWMITTAQEKNAFARTKKALEDFLMELSDATPGRVQIPSAPQTAVALSSNLEDYLSKVFALHDTLPPYFLDSVRRDL